MANKELIYFQNINENIFSNLMEIKNSSAVAKNFKGLTGNYHSVWKRCVVLMVIEHTDKEY